MLPEPQRRHGPREHRLERDEHHRARHRREPERRDPRPEVRGEEQPREQHQGERLAHCAGALPLARRQSERHREHQYEPPERDRDRRRGREPDDRAGVRGSQDGDDEDDERRHGRGQLNGKTCDRVS